MPSFIEHGWIMEGGVLKIKWISEEVAPDNTLNFVSCKCATGCESRRCSCRKANLACSDLCQCCNCSNNKTDTEEDRTSDDDDFFDDGSFGDLDEDDSGSESESE